MTESTLIAAAHFPNDSDAVRELFLEYMQSLGIDLSFQDVDSELAELPGKYAPPQGQILLARDNTGMPLGVVAVRPLSSPGTCEMKRLYVRPQARGQALGRRLALEIMKHAKQAGYQRIVLDTLTSLTAACQLYEALGFEEIAPYYRNPQPDVLYLGRDL